MLERKNHKRIEDKEMGVGFSLKLPMPINGGVCLHAPVALSA
jgi:hypothetical protein